ncbi:MAG: hypothetical protein QM401_04260 [Bacillota bacterium]|nr:hypothetical protein [Bacillota bacterium]
MITPQGISLLGQLIKDSLLNARTTVNGKVIETAIHRVETTADTVEIYTYLDETVVGTITRHQIIAKDNTVFLDKRDSVAKTDERGLLTRFELKIKED